MLEESFGLLIYLKKPKNHVGGPLPIYLRITVDCIAKEISLNRKWEKERWNLPAGRPLGLKADAKELDIFLQALQVRVYRAKRELMESGEQITAAGLMDLFSGKQKRDKLLLQIFAEHNIRMRALIGKTYAEGTCERFDTALKHTRDFIKWKYKRDDLNIYSLNSDFIEEMSFWFKTIKKCGHNTTMKYITNLKKVVLQCVDKGWLTRDPFASFSLSLEEKDPVFLTKEELQAIVEKPLRTGRLESVRDIFVFCCFTGLAFIDVKQLKRSEVCVGIDGNYWIQKNRHKSGVPSRIPLLPVTLQILEKYKNDPACSNGDLLLPVLSNQKYNSYLKELADICHIDKNLTSHTARHTFGTTVTLSNRVPIESVKEMMGHKHIRQTLHYARVLPIKLSEDMKLLKERLEQSEFVRKNFN